MKNNAIQQVEYISDIEFSYFTNLSKHAQEINFYPNKWNAQ